MRQVWLIRASVALNILTLLVLAGRWVHRQSQQARASASRQYRDDRLELLSTLPVTADSTVLAGDSLTDRGEWSELLSDHVVLNRGIAGDTVRDLKGRLPNLVKGMPQRIFLMVGINDLFGGRSAAEVAIDYEQLVRAIAESTPDTRVFVQSVLPANQDLANGAPARNHVNELNSRLRALSTRQECTFVDVAGVVSDAAGDLDSRFTRDGIHLNAEGYRRWAALLRSLGP